MSPLTPMSISNPVVGSGTGVILVCRVSWNSGERIGVERGKSTPGVDTATAMRIVGHKSEKMWKRYNAMEDSDLLKAASKLDTYLQTNTVLTPACFDEVTASITA
jgi:hypothetical protein